MYSRRKFLRNSKYTAGALALSPIMQQLKAHAAGNPLKLTKRFVFIMPSNGIRPYAVVPQGLDEFGQDKYSSDQKKATKTIDQPLHNLKLNPCMKSLEPFKKKLTIVQGLSSRICKGPHGGHYGVLGAYTSGDHAPPRKQTLDITLANQFPSIFPNLAFHIGVKPEELFRYLDISAMGKNTRTPAYASPMLAYKDIFGTILANDSAKVEADANRNLMDFLVNDVKQAQKRLNTEEKEKLDHYLHGFEALRDRQVKLTQMNNTLKAHAPGLDDKYKSQIETHRLEAHFDIATATLITGLTNVITIRADELDNRYQGFNHKRMKDISVHDIGHTADVEGTTDRFANDWKSGRTMRQLIRTYQFDLIARMAKKLQAVPEGDGTMLDNTLIIFLSDAGSNHHTSYHNMPVILLGNMNNQLNTGRYIHYPAYNNPNHRTLRNLLMTIQHAAGIPVDNFGDKDLQLLPSINQDGPLTELFA